MSFYKESCDIFRLKVPFEDLYTSVFLIRTKKVNILVDCATYDSDVDEYIVPALNQLGLSIVDIKYLVLTHLHADHTGGKNRILTLSPNIQVVQMAEKFEVEGVTLLEMKGHTLDSIGVFDKRSSTLISGDSLQGLGVGKYRCSLEDKREYLKTIEKVKKDKKIENILFSHAYEPWNTDGVFGRRNVEKVLTDCINCAK